MQTFTLIWLGQMVSTIGSAMTAFALSLWVWQRTESATALALFGFCAQLPRIVITLFAGVMVDRTNRKRLMMVGDTSAILCTIAVGILYATNQLQVWHLYSAVVLKACFEHIQSLAYSAAIALMVPKQHYTRASSMVSMLPYGAAILAPALAGSLYPVIDVSGMIVIDVITFAFAIGALLTVQIPQPGQVVAVEPEPLWRSLTFGFRYIWKHPSLLSMTIAFSLFWLPYQIAATLQKPLILARTDGNALILGSVSAAMGIGGVVGAIALTTWGGFQRRIHGMLIGFVAVGLSQLVFGWGQTPSIWMPAGFCAALTVPLLFSSSSAIWYAKIAHNLQGRVFAADHLVGLIIAAIATLIAGPLADTVFEPALRSGDGLQTLFAPIVGTQPGSGIALLYMATALSIVLIGLGGYAVRSLRQAEDLMPDHDVYNDEVG